ncbi:hypothetical protein FRC03_001096 [Tulasnella sp. 419]|nr:hypothetical protein FRC03_001096 [Tulasnella sp. 419]
MRVLGIIITTAFDINAMKFSAIALSILSTLAPFVAATPDPNQPAYVGYATLNGGTSGGIGGATTTVTSLAALRTAVADDVARVVIVAAGTYSGNEVIKVGANKSIIGASPGPSLVGVGLRVLEKSNVIIRNLKISKVLADVGDVIGVQGVTVKNVWIDQCDLSNDMDHSKDYYDGLLDITHGVQYVSVTYTKFHDHWKGSLVGHSDNNASEDTVITVTYAYNSWSNINSRMPSFRFGRGHVFNSYFLNSGDGINTRQGAKLLVENNVFSGVKKPVFEDGGCATVQNNENAIPNTAPSCGTLTMPYGYSLLSLSSVVSHVTTNAGAH